jgi:hypothetical protein
MDYPELNLLVGLGLALALSTCLSFLALIIRMSYPAILKLFLGILVGLGMLAAGYVYYLLFLLLFPTYRMILVVGMALVAGSAILEVRWLSRVEFSGFMRVMLVLLLVVSLALTAWLGAVLYRSLVPIPEALLSQHPFTLYPLNAWRSWYA